MRFVFREDENVVDAIDLPAEEGKRVTDILQMERPELFWLHRREPWMNTM